MQPFAGGLNRLLHLFMIPALVPAAQLKCWERETDMKRVRFLISLLIATAMLTAWAHATDEQPRRTQTLSEAPTTNQVASLVHGCSGASKPTSRR
ncbi:MAG TPA: hypothetical protein DCZ69_16790 [Syntrophobacteraceae bacterium]|nr:hypothetical protein [Syntrophobacteraceae bacterium]HBD09909.1 hypothetical protein [Syntrophobacteraceae bacterium]HBZ55974.1 hypothetical protein [Syntrophobacteraceae bacterium]